MKADNMVSIWLGNFQDQQELENYLEKIYDEDDEVSSSFMNNFLIDFYDEDFQEAHHLPGKIASTRETFLEPLSYSETFIGKVNFESWSHYNAVISLFNFDYKSERATENVIFVGSYPYNRTDEPAQ